MYTTKKLKYNKTPELDTLAHESGRVYSKVISLLWKVKRKKGFWLSQGLSRSICACVDTISTLRRYKR